MLKTLLVVTWHGLGRRACSVLESLSILLSNFELASYKVCFTRDQHMWEDGYWAKSALLELLSVVGSGLTQSLLEESCLRESNEYRFCSKSEFWTDA